MQYFKIISLLIFTFMFLSCSKHPEDKIVARVGDEEITFSEFDMDFNLYPHYRQNSTMRNARLEQINYMIDRVYLKMAAQQEGLDQEPDITEKLDYIRYKEILKRLYEKNVLDSIHISDDDAWQEYKKSNIQVKMRHLFAKTKEQAEKYFQELQAGASFSELALSCFKDSILAHNGGDLGFLNITDLDPLLVDSVYNQRIGQFSKPLQSSYGYHIIRVDDIKQSVFLSKEYFEQNKDYYVNSLKTRRATRRSAEFVSEALKGKSVNINPKIFRRLLIIIHLPYRRLPI
ncbi:MAG: peptidylprolyl isomerase [Calditrichia bacterium]